MFLPSRRSLAFLAAFSFCGIFQQAAHGQRPLPADQDLSKWEDISVEYFEIKMRSVDHYLEFTNDPPEVQEMVQEYLRHRYLSHYKLPGGTSLEAIRAEGEAVIAAGSRDPLVFSNHLPYLIDTGDAQGAKDRFEECWRAFEGSDYPIQYRVCSLTCMMLALIDLPTHKRPFENWATVNAEMLAQWMIEQPDDDRAEELIWREAGFLFRLNYRGVKFMGVQKVLFDQVAENDDVDPWLREMVAGFYLYNLAWHHRGGGITGEVNEESWEKFREYLPQAGNHFQRAYELRPDLPYAATAMILVANAGEDDTPVREWFDRAVEAQFYYTPAYESYLFTLTPRWGGSHAAMFEFGKECAATRRYDTNLPYFFITAVNNIDRGRGAQGEVWQRESVYELAKYTLEHMAEDPSREGPVHYIPSKPRVDLLCELAAIAVLAGELSDARTLLEDMSLPEDRMSFAFQSNGLLLERERPMIYAYTGPAADVLTRVDEMLTGPGGDDLTPRELDRIETMLVRAEGLVRDVRANDDRTQPYIDAIRTRLAADEAFDNGEWIDLPFDTAMTHWRVEGGSWEVQEDGSIIGDSTTTNDFALLLAIDREVEGPVVVEFDVETLKGHIPFEAGGLLMGNYTVHQATVHANLFHFYSAGREQRIGYQTPRQDPLSSLTRLNDNSRIRVRADDGYFEMFASGRTAVIISEDRFRLGNTIGLGAAFWLEPECRLRFNNVRMRRWTEGPPPDYNDFEARVEYFTETTSRNSEDPDAWVKLGVAQYFLKDYDPAAVSFDKALEFDPHWPGAEKFLGSCYENISQYEQAIEAFRAALEEDAADTFSRERLTFIQATCPIDELRDGEAALNTAVELCQATDYKGIASLKVLAVAYAEQGQFEEAIRYAEQAVELSEGTEGEKEDYAPLDDFRAGRPHRTLTREAYLASLQEE